MEREIQLPKDLEMFGCLFPEYTAMEIDLIISVIETVVNKLGPPTNTTGKSSHIPLQVVKFLEMCASCWSL